MIEELAKAHLVVAELWGTQAFLTAGVLLCYIWRNRPLQPSALRFQIALGLAVVCASDAINGALATAFWNHITTLDDFHRMKFITLWLLVPTRAAATFGFIIAVRAVSYQKYGEKLWPWFALGSFAVGLLLYMYGG
jgi:hypothetical protein